MYDLVTYFHSSLSVFLFLGGVGWLSQGSNLSKEPYWGLVDSASCRYFGGWFHLWCFQPFACFAPHRRTSSLAQWWLGWVGSWLTCDPPKNKAETRNKIPCDFQHHLRWNHLNKTPQTCERNTGSQKPWRQSQQIRLYRVSPETVWGLWIFGGTSIRNSFGATISSS